jgi:hypothetical protein
MFLIAHIISYTTCNFFIHILSKFIPKNIVLLCHNPNLGLVTKARFQKSAGQKKSLGVWESVRMNIHTPK